MIWNPLLVPGKCDNTCYPCDEDPPACCTNNTQTPTSVTLSGYGGALAFANGTYSLSNVGGCVWVGSLIVRETDCAAAVDTSVEGPNTYYALEWEVNISLIKSDIALDGRAYIRMTIDAEVSERVTNAIVTCNSTSQFPSGVSNYEATTCDFGDLTLYDTNNDLPPRFAGTIGTASLTYS